MSIIITVKNGICQGGVHGVGQVIKVKRTTPEDMCMGAWNAIAPYITALRYGVNSSWEKEEGVATIHCPDPKSTNLELHRSG